MRAVIQRAINANCKVNNVITGEIKIGFVVLLGICNDDNEEDIKWLAQKIVNLRVFSDDEGLMNKSLSDVDGNILLISQFTLFAQTKKGNRPSFINAAKSDIAIPIYKKMILEMNNLLGKKISKGVFGADMQISLINDGPVTIIIDTKNKE
ncbi:D-tyrosyl-tRNA(Tyr) deacylase [Pedobacter psychrophilus]|uniref:D-aminoacyl-tRNA deacylase n=1 Tax=Pedobacter psychrophilus TaxID=1826909 RepID=A0A179DE95_9SPHI|nr:D-aminoacyl-tRNA deacylase [Pedobacter psychrophilus]OAQ39288.1 D-tyrosyl-tRNA(Tyr) deacylase [Pedobacter psychrophilus]